MANIQNLYERFLASSGVCTDTRKISKDCLFFALKGPNFNGNAFALQAIDKGAKHVVIDELTDENQQGLKEGDYTLVEDTLETLQKLARYHRKSLSIPVIGITGSNGKTTTKELMHKVLATKYKTFATQGNLNNHIGVPLSILSINAEHEMAIIEMGANHVGEIASYCSVALPTHGLITNIGRAHIGEFGGFENIIRGKSELYDFIRNTSGVAFINTDDDVLKNMKKRFDNGITYPNESDTYPLELNSTHHHISFSSNEVGVTATSLTGIYNFSNIAAAYAVGRYFEVEAKDCAHAISLYRPSNMRSEVIQTEKYTIILDAYNANPDSMEAALKSLCAIDDYDTVCILGDMYELGDTTEEEHRKLGEIAVDLGVSKRYYVGEMIQLATEGDNFGHYFKEKSALIDHLKENPPKEGSFILIKGSRKNALESIMEPLGWKSNK